MSKNKISLNVISSKKIKKKHYVMIKANKKCALKSLDLRKYKVKRLRNISTRSKKITKQKETNLNFKLVFKNAKKKKKDNQRENTPNLSQ